MGGGVDDVGGEHLGHVSTPLVRGAVVDVDGVALPAALSLDPPPRRFDGEEVGGASGAQAVATGDRDADLGRQAADAAESRLPKSLDWH